jgi:hypothetical protein
MSGTAQQGQTLSITTGSWTGSPTSYSYQWQDCDSAGASCANIGGSANPTTAARVEMQREMLIVGRYADVVNHHRAVSSQNSPTGPRRRRLIPDTRLGQATSLQTASAVAASHKRE